MDKRIVTLEDVKKYLEDLKTYPDYDEKISRVSLNPSFCCGAQSAIDATLNWISMAIEHNRGRG